MSWRFVKGEGSLLRPLEIGSILSVNLAFIITGQEEGNLPLASISALVAAARPVPGLEDFIDDASLGPTLTLGLPWIFSQVFPRSRSRMTGPGEAVTGNDVKNPIKSSSALPST
ncbi:hypothetical protein AB1N83_003387 [Pleurotus pulmonarius]